MKKLVFTVILMSLFAVMSFSQDVAFLVRKEDGKVMDQYKVSLEEAMGEYYNNLLDIMQSDPSYDTFLNMPQNLYYTIGSLADFLIIQYYLDEKGIVVNMDSVMSQTKELYDAYMTNDMYRDYLTSVFENENNFYSYVRGIFVKDALIGSLRNQFTDISKDRVLNYVTNNFNNLVLELSTESETYETPESMMESPTIVEKMIFDIATNDLVEWFSIYRTKFDFAVNYKPLELEEKLQKTVDMNEKIQLEEEYRGKIMTAEKIPQEWLISYSMLADQVITDKKAILQEINVYAQLKTVYPEESKMTPEQIDSLVAGIVEEQSTAASTEVSEKLMQKENDLRNLAYLVYYYNGLSDSQIQALKADSENKISEIEAFHVTALKNLYRFNPDNGNLVYKIHELDPDDPVIAYQYFESFYSMLVQYIDDPVNRDIVILKLTEIKQQAEVIASSIKDNAELQALYTELIKEIDSLIK